MFVILFITNFYFKLLQVFSPPVFPAGNDFTIKALPVTDNLTELDAVAIETNVRIDINTDFKNLFLFYMFLILRFLLHFRLFYL